MKRDISKDLTIYLSNHYPYRSKTKSKKRYTVVLGFGGNIGHTKRLFDKIFLNFKKNSQIYIKQTSFLLKNPPFGYEKQKDFLNTVMIIKTNKTAKSMLKFCQYIEKRHHRVKLFKDAPRTIDIDIVAYKKGKNMITHHSHNLTIPHKHWKERASVVLPLKFIKKKKHR